MPKHHRKKKNLIYGLVAVGLVLLVVLGLASQGLIKLPGMIWTAPGWEIYNAVGGLREQSMIFSRAAQFTNPVDLLGNYWYVDLDAPKYGLANMMVELGDIVHTDFTGKETPITQPAAAPIIKTIGNQTYELDEHIYTYTVTVRTVADIIKYPGGIFTIPTFDHETSWPYEMYQFYGRNSNNPPHVGQLFSGGVYTKFIINPWKGPYSFLSPPNASYVLTGAWAGVMNTYVIAKTAGQVTNTWPNIGPSPGGTPITPDGNAEPIVSGSIDPGNQLPMFADDGTFANPITEVNWDPNFAPDSRILNQSSVAIFYPFQMEAGAKLDIDIGQTVQNMYPCDVAIQFTVRVDVLMTHQFTLQSAIQPPNPSWPSDYFGWAESFWTSLLNGLNPFGFLGPLSPLAWFIVTLVALGFIGMIVLAIFAPWTLPRIFGGFRKSYDALRGKG